MTDILGTKYYCLKEARVMLRVGKNKMYDMVKNKEIDCVYKAGVIHLTDEGIKHYITQNTVRAERPKLITRN